MYTLHTRFWYSFNRFTCCHLPKASVKFGHWTRYCIRSQTDVWVNLKKLHLLLHKTFESAKESIFKRFNQHLMSIYTPPLMGTTWKKKKIKTTTHTRCCCCCCCLHLLPNLWSSSLQASIRISSIFFSSSDALRSSCSYGNTKSQNAMILVLTFTFIAPRKG